ncbi:MAG: efflux RND transporter periplasmic adaptor subunit [Proteobacteria bacterium]|nr:MAG: efflux RND transporter periplasmic adaptor subunit [Pseudomonadota bacterium]
MTPRVSRLVARGVLIMAVFVSVGGYCGAAFATTYTGTLVMANEFEIRAAVSGRVDSTAVAAGRTFSRGSELVSIEKALYHARQAAAAVQLDLAHRELGESEKAFARDEILYEEGSLSQVDFDQAQLALQRARAAFNRAETNNLAARLDADLAVIEAPFDGVSLDRDVAPGEYVSALTSAPRIATIAERGRFAARFRVDAAVRATLRLGATGTVSRGDDKFGGAIGAIRIDRTTNGDTAWLVDLYFDSDSDDLAAGMPVEVDLP